jgi:uncharacterized protein
MKSACNRFQAVLRNAISFLCITGSTVSTVIAATPPAATGPGFDCSRAKGQAQELVCADKQLATLDRELARLYTLAARSPQLSTKQRASLRAYQHGWIKGRNDCWKADDLRACVLDSYVMRIHELRRDYADARSDTTDSLSRGPVYVTCDGSEARMAATFINTDPQLACLEAQGRLYTLPLAVSASGARYTATTGEGEVTFWSKGTEARVTLPGQATLSCHTEAAR